MAQVAIDIDHDGPKSPLQGEETFLMALLHDVLVIKH